MRMSPGLPVDANARARELDFSDDPLDREGRFPKRVNWTEKPLNRHAFAK